MADDKIYILIGEKYLVGKFETNKYVLYDVYNDSDTYIPTTRVTVDGVTWSDLEAYNLLTSKYKEGYIGDIKTIDAGENLDFSAMFSEPKKYDAPEN